MIQTVRNFDHADGELIMSMHTPVTYLTCRWQLRLGAEKAKLAMAARGQRSQ